MSALFVGTLLASLAGSLHCVGMCGPIVAFYSAADGLPKILGHLLYNLGRLQTCLIIGAVAGGLGAAMNIAGSLASVQHAALIVAAMVMIVWGLVRLLSVLGLRRSSTTSTSPLITRLLKITRGRSPLTQTAILGLLTPLLPCGWLYAFALAAAGSGRAASGALVMGAFWLGTLPALLGLGASIQWLSKPLRRHLPAITAVALLVIGLLTLGSRLYVDPFTPQHGKKGCPCGKR